MLVNNFNRKEKSIMSTKILHGQMSVVDENGNVTILHQETSASDVLVSTTGNTQGVDGASAIPSDVDNLEKLTNKMGAMAFKTIVEAEDLDNDYICLEESEDIEFDEPISEINDDVIGTDSTWSSKKIDEEIKASSNEIVQTTGDSEDKIMSQKAVTDELDKLTTNHTNNISAITARLDTLEESVTTITADISEIDTLIGEGV